MEDSLARLFVLSYLVFFGGLGWLAASLIKRRNIRKPAALVVISLAALVVSFVLR